MDSRYLTRILKLTQGHSLFHYQDRSSEETIRINRRLSITTDNWLAVKNQFIEERYSRRIHEAWSRAEWAEQEQKMLEKIDFSNSQDRQVLKNRYLKELSKIANGRIKIIEKPLSFKWKGQSSQLKKLYNELSKKYIKANWNDFKQLFDQIEIGSIKSIQWMQANWELFFLIEELSNHYNLIEYKEINVTIQNCFIDKNGNPFKNASLKSQKSNAKSGGASKTKQDSLNSLIQAVKETK
jgi:hypothetical protein